MLRSVKLALAVAATAVLGSTLFTAPASAGNIDQRGVDPRCNASPYLLCLYWDTFERGAYWGTSSNVANLAGLRFFNGTGQGSGTAVKNNAASMSCDTATLRCFSYFNEGFTGSSDFLTPQHSGNLVQTWNDEASVRLV